MSVIHPTISFSGSRMNESVSSSFLRERDWVCEGGIIDIRELYAMIAVLSVCDRLLGIVAEFVLVFYAFSFLSTIVALVSRWNKYFDNRFQIVKLLGYRIE